MTISDNISDTITVILAVMVFFISNKCFKIIIDKAIIKNDIRSISTTGEGWANIVMVLFNMLNVILLLWMKNQAVKYSAQ